jgi:hypothetical protein
MNKTRKFLPFLEAFIGWQTNCLTFVTANYQLLLNPPEPEGSKGK